MQSDMFPEQRQALEYLRRKGTEAPVAEIRSKVEETFRELDALLAGIPEHVVRVWPRPGRWCVQEVVDHLVESHRPVVGELAALLRGEVPRGGPVPASLQSPDAMEKEWIELVRELARVHAELAALVRTAPEDAPLEARAPVVMVVKVRGEDGVVRPAQWVEELDWKAYVIAFRAHALEHVAQIRKTLEETGF